MVEGLKVLRNLEIGEKIEKVEPIFTIGLDGIKIRAGGEERIFDGDEIYSFAVLELREDLPNSSEYVMTIFEGNCEVEEVTNTYVRFKGKRWLMRGEESQERRSRGTVTLRKSGKNAGDVYVYLRDRMPYKDHTVIGFIRSGIESF